MSRIRSLWEQYGKNDPYFAVVTVNQNKKANANETTRSEFFGTGSDHVMRLWNIIEVDFAGGFQPKTTLDFGCGVGRIAIPLATRSGHVTAVDIADNMLAEARRNCSIQGISNIDFLQTDRYLENEMSFDLIHSFIVLQHIHPDIGMPIVQKMLRDLNEDGIGALHFTYADTGSRRAKVLTRIYRDFPLVYRLRRALSKGPTSPIIPTFLYDLHTVMTELYQAGCHEVTIRFSNHGLLGVFLVFRKRAMPSV